MVEQEIKIRWMIRSDMKRVLAIEAACFDYPWSEDDFIRVLRQRNCIGMVVQIGAQIVGFMVYELHKSEIMLLNLAVDPDSSGVGVGKAMMERLKSKLSTKRRTRLRLEVRETNLAAQQFFRRCGLSAVSILRGHYEETGEDAYVMQYRMGERRPVISNRISRVVG